MLQKNITALSAREEYEGFISSKKIYSSRLLSMTGVKGYDVYNPSVPFELLGKEYIAARVEKRESEDSRVRIFERKNEDEWTVAESAELRLQDPFVTKIGGKIIIGGVRVEFFPDHAEWVTDFYYMKSLSDFCYITSGPKQMKDIRLLELKGGRIAVFSRPQGESTLKKYGAIAKIGFTALNSIDELNAKAIENAPILEGQFLPDEWGGANQLYMLKNGLIGVIGHKAYRTYDNEGRQMLHYYGMSFAVDPETREVTPVKIILSNDCFPLSAAKRPDLCDVVFMSGIVRNKNLTATAYSGINDTSIGCAVIDDPFIEYENLKR